MKINIYLISFVFLFSVLASSCGNRNDKPLSADLVNNPNSASGKGETGGLPEFEFEEEEHDFGNITEGEKVTYSFKFKNVGNADLLISQGHASCGCTNLEYPKKPVKPGETSYVSVTFDSKNKSGVNTKTISLVANTQPNEKVLKISANVIAP